MKKITHIKDSEGNIYKIAEEPVIFGKALPQHPLAGKRYFFSKDLNIKFNSEEEAIQFKNWFDEQARQESYFFKNYSKGYKDYISNTLDAKSIRVIVQIHLLEKKLILNIPENFDLHRFFTEESYFKSIIEIANNYTGDTASPNFKIVSGEIEYIENVIKFQGNQLLKPITKPILFVWKKRRRNTSNRQDELTRVIKGNTYRKKIWKPEKKIPIKKFIATLFNYKLRKGKKYFGRSFKVCLKYINGNNFLSLIQ